MKNADSKGKTIQSLGSWFFDKRSRKRKYVTLTGRVVTGPEAVRLSRADQYSESHPAQQLRLELCMLSSIVSVEHLLQKQRKQLSILTAEVSEISLSDIEGSLLSLAEWGLPDQVLKRYKQAKISRLFPWQVDCLLTDSGAVLSGGRNMIYTAPTSGGKTLVAELLMLRKISATMSLGDPTIHPRKTIFFVVPFIALAEEKMTYLQYMWQDLNIGVKGFHGEDGSSSVLGEDVEVVVCTIERANILFTQLLDAHREDQISMVIVDEIHLLSDQQRGFLLEVLLSKVKFILKEKVQIIGMSATLPNIADLANWLDATLYTTTYRPVSLKTFVCMDNIMYAVQSREVSPPTLPPPQPIPQTVPLHTLGGVADANCVDIYDIPPFDDGLLTDAMLMDVVTEDTNDSGTYSVSTLTSHIHLDENHNHSRHLNNNLPVTSTEIGTASKNYSTDTSIKSLHGVDTSYIGAVGSSGQGDVKKVREVDLIYQRHIPRTHALKDDRDGLLQLCLETVQANQSALVFCNSKQRCETVATKIAQALQQQQSTSSISSYSTTAASMPPGSAATNAAKTLTSATHLSTSPSSATISTSSSSSSFQPMIALSSSHSTPLLFQTHAQHLQQQRSALLQQLQELAAGLCPVLRSTIPYGVAYHHAGLTQDERKLVEEAFKAHVVQILCTTSTLAAGVNLPAHRVIIRSLQMGDSYLSVAAFRQMCGRAGRTGLDVHGEAIVMVDNQAFGSATSAASATVASAFAGASFSNTATASSKETRSVGASLASSYRNTAGIRSYAQAQPAAPIGNSGTLKTSFSALGRSKERSHCEQLLTCDLDPLTSCLHTAHGGGLEKLLLEMIVCRRLTHDHMVLPFVQCTLFAAQQQPSHTSPLTSTVPDDSNLTTASANPTYNHRNGDGGSNAMGGVNTNAEIVSASSTSSVAVESVRRAMIFLRREQLVQNTSTGSLAPSPFGKATTLAGLSPQEAVATLPALLQAKSRFLLQAGGLHGVYLITPVTTAPLEPPWTAYESLLDALYREYPDAQAVAEYLGIFRHTAQSFRFSAKPSWHHLPELYKRYKRFYNALVLFVLMQEWPLGKVLK